MCGTLWFSSSNSSGSSTMPSSRAMAGRWMAAFVEPPMALCTMMAFSKASRVRISPARMPCSASFGISRPARRAAAKISRMVAGMSAAPGSVRPSASAMHCMVLAVPRKEHAPQEGQPVSL